MEHVTICEKSKNPIYVWINFHNDIIGKKNQCKFIQFMDNNNLPKNLIPIEKVSSRISMKSQYEIFREQFPIVPAESITIHKSQGQTYEKVCIDLSKSHHFQTSLLYVALSRVKSLNDLFIIGEFKPPKKNQVSCFVNNEMNRLRKNKYLKLSYIDNVDSTKFKILYHNVRSLHKNISHILTDKWYHQFELLIFSETQTISSDEFTIKDYELIFRSDNNLIERKQKGIMCF